MVVGNGKVYSTLKPSIENFSSPWVVLHLYFASARKGIIYLGEEYSLRYLLEGSIRPWQRNRGK